MHSNNSKIASFYPSQKRPSNQNLFNNNLGNSVGIFPNNNDKGLFINNHPINYHDDTISDSLELALITVNLSYIRFKSMNKEELDNYVKTTAYYNSHDSKKYLLALNILNSEIDKTKNNLIIKQQPTNQNKNNKSQNYSFENKINMNDMICVEPDEFNLNTGAMHIDNISIINQSKLQSTSFNDTHNSQNLGNSYNTNIHDSNQKFPFKQNKNLDMSTYNGNPLGTFKITNNLPMNSLRPINQLNKQNTQFTNREDNSNTSNQINENSQFNSYNSYITHNSHNPNYDYSYENSTLNRNGIIRQTSTLSNSSMFQGNNNGRKRTSNLDVSNSNNYITIS
jgi:hypothetical protein